MEARKAIHIALLLVLLAGTVFAWYNSAKEVGLMPCATQVCTAPALMLGIPICVMGALFFTIALVLAVALWYKK
jgi:uncharacterized membrane protein